MLHNVDRSHKDRPEFCLQDARRPAGRGSGSSRNGLGVTALGRHLGVTVIAKGVETGEQMEYLDPMSVVDIQGFYIAKPMDATDCGKRLGEGLQA